MTQVVMANETLQNSSTSASPLLSDCRYKTLILQIPAGYSAEVVHEHRGLLFQLDNTSFMIISVVLTLPDQYAVRTLQLILQEQCNAMTIVCICIAIL